MGTACYSYQTKKQQLNDIRFRQQILMFRMEISGLKVKIFNMNEHLYKTTMIRYTKNPHWPITFTFYLHMDPQSMQTTFFKLQILDDSDKVHYKIIQYMKLPVDHNIMIFCLVKCYLQFRTNLLLFLISKYLRSFISKSIPSTFVVSQENNWEIQPTVFY
ncbi:unnamed protein product [Paramecium octaurelia]|uniref:C2 domain-containing protein n=1 Tax=Paramecium octaurelia TaxID=43137 RepID=A0A8S1YHM8_PAROT|nr:unnamed protein product [Paramecium octaurelia]